MNATYQASVSSSLLLRPGLLLLLRRCENYGRSSESSQSRVEPTLGALGIPASVSRERFHPEIKRVALDLSLSSPSIPEVLPLGRCIGQFWPRTLLLHYQKDRSSIDTNTILGLSRESTNTSLAPSMLELKACNDEHINSPALIKPKNPRHMAAHNIYAS